MRVLVTGASGFVGRWLVAHLRACGDDVRESATDVTDAPALGDEIRTCAPDAVYHLAGQADVGRSWEDPLGTYAVNATGTLHLLDAARRLDPRPRVLLVSSADVYGPVTPEELPITEAHPCRPASPYGASKVAAEVMGAQAWRGWGVPVVAARAFNHIGPGQSAAFVVSALAAQIADAERAGGDDISVGDLSSRRDFTDVRDVVRAYRLLVQHGQPGEAYNVCRGEDVAVSAVADRLLALARRPLRTVVDPGRVRPVEVPVLRGDCGRLRGATGWAPEHPIDATLAEVLAWWRDGAPPVP